MCIRDRLKSLLKSSPEESVSDSSVKSAMEISVVDGFASCAGLETTAQGVTEQNSVEHLSPGVNASRPKQRSAETPRCG